MGSSVIVASLHGIYERQYFSTSSVTSETIWIPIIRPDRSINSGDLILKRTYPSWSSNTNSYVSKSRTAGVLAVFQLRDDLIADGGEGNYNNPFILKSSEK